MSYKRKAKKLIINNSDFCYNCKHRQEVKRWRQTDIDDAKPYKVVRCNYLNLIINEEDANKSDIEFGRQFENCSYDYETIEKELLHFNDLQDLFRGYKICKVKTFDANKKLNKRSMEHKLHKFKDVVENQLELGQLELDDEDFPF